MAHGIRWRRTGCDRILFLNGIWFAWFCTEPGHWPIRFFLLSSPEGLTEVAPSIKQAKRAAEKIARRWRRRFRYQFAQLDATGSEEPDEMVSEMYPRAVRAAARSLGLPVSTFPPECPWTWEQIMDENFFPAAGRQGLRVKVQWPAK
jgi:Domain of unknown function DUF29